MSLGSLKIEITRLEGKLREAEAINRDLKNELSTVAGGVSRAHNTLEEYNIQMQNALQNSDKVMHASHERVIAAYELQGEIERLYVRFKNIELANKKIRAANNKKYYDFANYRTVRKIVQGMMDNLDVNMISDQTITKSVEVRHLQTPDYWLTCVLISIMAWKHDDKELAERAMARALALDKKHSAVFYMLFHLRMGRDEAALKWFAAYQEAEQKGSDQRTFLMLFSLISKTLTETVDENTRSKIAAYINQVILASAQAEGYSEADIVAKIRHHYTRFSVAEPLEYALLQKYCDAFAKLAANMALVKNNIHILEFILKIVNVPAEQKNEFLKNYLDELIDAPNQAEVEVDEEIAYHELVIKLEGDMATAKAEYEAEQQRAQGQLNLIAEIVGWIYERDNQAINGQIRLNMFTLSKDLQEKAIESYAADYRSRRKTVLPVTINDYTAEVDFNRESAEIEKIEKHCTDIKKSALAAVKNGKAWIGFILAALAAAGGVFMGRGFFVLTALGIGSGIFVLLTNRAKRKQQELTCQDNIRTATDILRKLFTEFRAYQKQFDEYDTYHERILNELNKI